MNYNEWVEAFEKMTPEQLNRIILAADIFESDEDIKREYGDLRIFGGYSLRSAAKEALVEKEKDTANNLALTAYTMVIVRLSTEYKHVDPGMIIRPETFEKIKRWISQLKDDKEREIDTLTDTAGAIIDSTIDDVYTQYPNTVSKFRKEAGVDGVSEEECSILYGESYYSLEDAIKDLLTDTFGQYPLISNEPSTEDDAETQYYWLCQCTERNIHKMSNTYCEICNTPAADGAHPFISAVVKQYLRAWL